MNIIITRPQADAEPLAQKLKTRGHTPLLLPLLEIVFLDDIELNLTEDTSLAFTSANGIRAVAQHIKDKSQKIFAIGKHTAEIAREFGFKNITIADEPNVAGLAKTIIAANPKNVLHIVGRREAGDLTGTLQAANIAAQKQVLYEARPTKPDNPEIVDVLITATPQNPIGVLLYSRASAVLFVEYWQSVCAPQNKECSSCVAFCLSPIVGAVASEVGFITHIAPHADEDALLKVLDSYVKSAKMIRR